LKIGNEEGESTQMTLMQLICADLFLALHVIRQRLNSFEKNLR
jgi:hypothetical protein